ncbi:MAG: L-lactate dehydrogenase [Kiritimatiellia bacterium]
MKRKVVIAGAGAVGATFAYALARDGSADEIVLNDAQRERAEGQALDLAHGLPFMPPVTIRDGSARDYSDAQIIVITAGGRQKAGQSRLDLLQKNSDIIRSIVDEITAAGSKAVLVVVTNPVDVLTRVALERTGWDRKRIMGSGTVLDTARFRYLIGHHCGVDTRNVHAYILGEHGDSEFAAWSRTHIGGVVMDKYCVMCGKCADWRRTREGIAGKVRESAYHIIDYKGATSYAIGLALVRIVNAILRNEHSVLTVSVRLQGEFGLKDVCLGVPCILSGDGVEAIMGGELSGDEQEHLNRSAGVLQKAWGDLQSGSK